jgi:hypothetical protein
VLKDDDTEFWLIIAGLLIAAILLVLVLSHQV